MTTLRLLTRIVPILFLTSLIAVAGAFLSGKQTQTGWEIVYRVAGYQNGGQIVRGMDIERGLSYTLLDRPTDFTSIVISPDRRFMLIAETPTDSGVGDPWISADPAPYQPWILIDRQRNHEQIAYRTSANRQPPIWSPDSRHFVYYDTGYVYIYTVDDAGEIVDSINVDLRARIELQPFYPIRWAGDNRSFQVMIPRTATTSLVQVSVDGAILGERELDFTYRGQSDWSPDGMYLLYALSDEVNDVDSLVLLDILADEEQVIFESNDTIRTAYWSRDASEVAVVTINSSFGSEVFMVNIDSGQSRLITTNDANRALWADWSPTSEHVFFPIQISYARTNHGQLQGRYPVDLFVYTREEDMTLGPIQIDLSADVHWSPDGSAFIFQSAQTGQLTVYNLADGSIRQITERGRDYSILP